jgi:hypothetical protein
VLSRTRYGDIVDLNTLKEYMNIHLISLNQDLDKHRPEDTLLVEYIEGQIVATEHFIGVLNG